MVGVGYRDPFDKTKRAHIASLALAGILNSGCAYGLRTPPIAESPITQLSGVSEQGTCSFDMNKNELSYSRGNQRAAVILDLEVRRPNKLLCGDPYSVILTDTLAIVGLGAESVFSGRESIGQYGEKFTWANSYFIDISEITLEKLTSARLYGAMLCMRTKAGKSWAVNVSNPEEWITDGSGGSQGVPSFYNHPTK